MAAAPSAGAPKTEAETVVEAASTALVRRCARKNKTAQAPVKAKVASKVVAAHAAWRKNKKGRGSDVDE